ncbi:hypothetical protein RJ639_022783 [Escallonia herrerae]|uniref:Uncharacterized protein n=1 Tax=Escallonia herrerae TaxID=1293975 RepID=A0AA89ACW1_9ASTE|nr:hypothetical protein RJ639_022783 [Escallonia herrerae]
MKLSHVAVVTLLVCYCLYTVAQEEHQQKTYIVHMDKSFMPTSFEDHFQWYESSLKSASSSADMLYAYNNVIHGFATRLMDEEVESLKGKPGILSMQEEMIYQLHTTRSPEFLGLGLVYDATVDDYLGFLCALNYSSIQIKALTKRDFTCESRKKYRVEDFNYPSIAVPLQTASGKGGGSSAPTIVQYTRTLTNVGTPTTYTVSVTSETQAVKILVMPKSLNFSEKNEKKSYTMTFTASSMPSGIISFARLQWSDGKHIVRESTVFRNPKSEVLRKPIDSKQHEKRHYPRKGH